MEEIMTIHKAARGRTMVYAPYVTALLLCLHLISCAGNRITQKGDAGPVRNDMTVTRSEYDDAGRDIVAALSSGDSETFLRTIDRKSLLDKAFRGLARDRRSLEARDMLDAAMDEAGKVMTKNLGENSYLKFIRSRLMRGEHRALVRVDMGDRGLSYIDFILGKDRNGEVRITDWYDYGQGQLYSEALCQALFYMYPGDEVLARKLPGGASVDRNILKYVAHMAELSREGRYREWLDAYKDLPGELKYSRNVLVTRVLVASAGGPYNEYLLALKDVNTYIGSDPSLSLLLIDHYLNERDYKAAHRALDRIYEYTGGDAALDFLRANVYLTEKKYPQSIEFAQRAIKEDPFYEEAYWTLLAVSIFTHRYNLAVDTLESLEHRFGYVFEPAEIARIRGYEEFARSSVFADWKYGIRP